MPENILVCTAWPYANGDLHIGHLAGAYLPPDIFARYHRLKGNKVLMVSGSDSHGTPITLRADAEGVSPRELFERFHLRFLDTFQRIGITYNLFTHTDTENHHRVSQDVFTACLNNGYLYTQTEQQFYSENEGRFLPDRYIEGTCPHCGYLGARGDQCDNCKKLLDPTELIDPRSKTDGTTPVLRQTEHFYLDLAKLGPAVEEYLADKDYWRPNVINFSRQYIKEGLKGRPITRDLEWGIPIPLEGYAGKRIYVWFEAVIGYFSASIEWAANAGEPEKWKDWWYDPSAKTYYFIGKDNIPFHAVIWPAELIGTGRRLYEDDPDKLLNLPYDVPSNEYLNMEGQKLSTSRNWAIWAPDLLERFDPDPIRFYLTFIAPESRDTDFTFEDFVRRNNDELVATWGNLANRVLGFAYKRYNGQVPQIGPNGLDATDRQILAEVEAGFESVGQLLAEVKLKAALDEAFRLARLANVYLDRKAPWQMIKEDPAAAGTSIYVALRVIDSLKILLAPFLPHTCQLLHEFLGYNGQLFGRQYTRSFSEQQREHVALGYDGSQATGRWEPSQLLPGQLLRQPAPLFKKLEPEVAAAEVQRLLIA
ncbi:MAG: methionine--tRNA ligase [Anaerolineae bacterium]|nr:methionine--tRNA ligase [Anaerolineae bacterium]